MSAGERLYRALAILVVAAITAATAILIAAIALISRRGLEGVRDPASAEGGSEPEDMQNGPSRDSAAAASR